MSLVAEYRASLKNPAVEEDVDLIIFRPLAFLFVKAIYGTSLTPNQVTLLSMIVGISSGICFAIGGPTTIIVGGILLGAATVLDCADGQLARLKKIGTSLGRIFDGVVDYVYTIAAFLGIAVGCRNESMDPWLWWLFVASAGASYAIQAGILDYYRIEYLAYVRGRSGFLRQEMDEISAEHKKYSDMDGHYVEKILLPIYLKYSRIQNELEKADNRQVGEIASTYIRKNALMIRLWSLNGTSTHVFVLILCSFAGRIDLFLWYVLIFGSLYSLLLYGIQRFRAKRGK